MIVKGLRLIRVKYINMKVKERILEMEREFAVESSRPPRENIGELMLTFLFKFQIFEPCKYLSEDEEWVNFLILPPDDAFGSQMMSLKKDDIISMGILNEKNIAENSNLISQIEPESLYQ